MQKPASKMLTEHFSVSEFRCKCGRKECDAVTMRSAFMRKLEALRVEWGKKLAPTSGTRCNYWNEHDSVRGSTKSQHLKGNAADFNFYVMKEKHQFAELAEKFGFNGIGIGIYLVHIDDRKTPARWAYDNK